MRQWDELEFWKSPEWEAIQISLDQCAKLNPLRENLFAALDACPFEKTSVAIIGQDPYPDPRLATGLAFSIPEDVYEFPPTLRTIFEEYERDLHYPRPTSGALNPWCDRGCLLWNAIPSCESWRSLSHEWPEWRLLTSQIIEALCTQGIVFVLLGGRARSFADIINYYELLAPGENILIELCHPSPRAINSARKENKFLGSRLFSHINDSLVRLGRPPIDWRLP